MNQLMTSHSIRSHQEPLTNDQLRAYAPSIFAPTPWYQMSARYAFIPTIQVIDKMRAEGFMPVEAMQSRSRVPGKFDFTKHLIRFRDIRQTDVRVGGIYPELLLTNSHDGASAYRLDSGLFRAVCTNGLVVGDSIVSHVDVKHRGNPGDVVEATFEIVEQMPKVIESVEKFQALRLEAGEQKAFATAALALRYEDGEAPVSPERLIAPRREEDVAPTLWNTYNVVQERLVQGGDRYRTAPQDGRPSRRMRTRAVTGIAENTRLNKALWTLAEEMRKLRN